MPKQRIGTWRYYDTYSKDNYAVGDIQQRTKKLNQQNPGQEFVYKSDGNKWLVYQRPVATGNKRRIVPATPAEQKETARVDANRKQAF